MLWTVLGPLRLLPRSALSRVCLFLWLAVITVDALRAAYDAFEDATTGALPAGLAAGALAVTACAMIRAATAQTAMREARGALRVIAVFLWLLTFATLFARNAGGHHPAGYLLGFLYVEGVAAATATLSLVIRAAGGRDKDRLIRALAKATERNDPQLESHLRWAKSESSPGGR